jgi:hypothetical protein
MERNAREQRTSSKRAGTTSKEGKSVHGGRRERENGRGWMASYTMHTKIKKIKDVS